MVKKEDVEQLMLQHLPQCPICKAESGYEVSGLLKNYVQCKSCKAQWQSNDFVNCKELNVLMLWKLSRDGLGKQFRKKEHPIRFWRTMMHVDTFSEFLQRMEEDKKINQLFNDPRIQSFGRQLGGMMFTSEREKKEIIQKLEEIARLHGQTFFEYVTENRPSFSAGLHLVLMGDERGIEPLFNSLKKGVESVDNRIREVSALTLLEKANKTGKTLDPIIWVLQNDKKVQVRIHAAYVLGELKGYPKVVDALIKALGDIGVLNIREEDLYGRVKWKYNTVNLAAIDALKKIGDERGLTAAIDYCLSCLKPNYFSNFSLDAANWTRENTVIGLEHLGWKPANDSDAINYWAAKN